MKSVYLVSHIHELPDGDSVKLIGVYASQGDADAAIARAKLRPGFSECPEGFFADLYEIGEDNWVEGYVTLRPEDS